MRRADRGPRGGEGRARRPSRPLGAGLGAPLLAAAVALTAACGETTRGAIRVEDDLLDPNPSRRTAAVGIARRDGDRSRVPLLIELLDDPDPGVRLAAGATLVEMTGHDTGYVPWAGPAERRAHVGRWRRWWEASGGGPSPPPAAPSTAPSPSTPPPPDRSTSPRPRVPPPPPPPPLSGAAR